MSHDPDKPTGTGDQPRDSVIQEPRPIRPATKILRLKLRDGTVREIRPRASAPNAEVEQVRPAIARNEIEPRGRAFPGGLQKPWPEPVEGGRLLVALIDFFCRYVYLEAGLAIVLAIWSIHTYCAGSAEHTPRLAVTSPEKGCGKTTVLKLLKMVCCRPILAANITSAALYHVVEALRPTLLVDEADTFLKQGTDIVGVLNSGHERDGQVLRCVGKSHEAQAFSTFAPVAIACIGHLPATLADRSINCRMCKARPEERPEPIRRKTREEAAVLASKMARWCADHAEGLTDAEPSLPEWMSNREADNWRILFAIAEAAGDDWPRQLERAAAALSDGADGRESLGVALLHDIRLIFDECGAERLPTAAIVGYLKRMDDRPWPEMPGSGRPLTSHWCTQTLKAFGAPRRQWRVHGTGDREWGFYRSDLEDIFSRYLDPVPDGSPEGR